MHFQKCRTVPLNQAVHCFSLFPPSSLACPTQAEDDVKYRNAEDFNQSQITFSFQFTPCQDVWSTADA